MPMMIISVFMFYFRGWLVDGVSLMESVSYSAMDYRKVIETLLTWRNPVNGMGHLWYLYVYILVMIETISNPQQSWGDSWTQVAINVVSN